MQENSFANALYMLLLAVCVAFTQAARAEVNEDNAQQEYYRTCQPGSYADDPANDREREDTRVWRQHYRGFLANPEPTIAALMDSALVKPEKRQGMSVKEQLDLIFLFGGSCEPTLHFAPWLQELGCKDEQGLVHPGQKALALCQELARAMRNRQ